MTEITVPHIKTIESVKEFEKIFTKAFGYSDFQASKYWSLGGSSGGDCYGNPTQAYPGDEDPDPELENRVFKIMTAFWPDMTITEFSELREQKEFLKLKVENDSFSDYYGNYSSDASVSADFKDFYAFAHR